MKSSKFRIFEILYIILVAQLLSYLAMVMLVIFLRPAWDILQNPNYDILMVFFSAFTIASQTSCCIWVGCYLLLKLPTKYHDAVYTYTATKVELMPVAKALSLISLAIPIIILFSGAIFSELYPSLKNTLLTLSAYCADIICFAGIIAIVLMFTMIWFMRRYRRTTINETESH